MPETRKWLLPWGMDDNNNPDDPDDPEPPKPSVEADNKASTKKPPQYTLESAEILIPDEGLKEGQPYKFTGKVRRLDGAAPSNASISVQSVYRYKNEEQICGNPEIAEINKDTLEFTGEFNELFEPNAYYLDKGKTPDSKFTLILKLRGGCLDKDSFSSEVKLPMATKDYILKKGCYDETWADAKKDDAEYPKSGDKYFPKDTVKKVQTLLIKLRFLITGNDTGYFGDLTETAIHEFQRASKGQNRSKANDGRIFFIGKNEISFTGEDDGIYGPETEKELAQWNSNGWVRPKEDFKINDIDENGVRNGHGERGTENYHEGNQILDFQKLLKDIGAYLGKLDGWLGPKTEAAVIWLRECVEKCDFVDETGKKVNLDVNGSLKGHRPKHADEPLKKAAEKVKEKGATVTKDVKNDPQNLEPVTVEDGERIVTIAKNWVGTPYKSPGSSKTGADCCGAVWAIFKEAGFDFDYVSATNYPTLSNFKPAPENNPQVGDVGWWSGHVMIYDQNAGKTNRGEIANGWSATRPGGSPYCAARYQWFDSNYKTPVKWYRFYKQKAK